LGIVCRIATIAARRTVVDDDPGASERLRAHRPPRRDPARGFSGIELDRLDEETGFWEGCI
jgi:hypothetical protein